MDFDFSVPIIWSDIINIISTFVAFCAVIVAIVANYKASQSLEYSLKIQEQSKNIDLFEKRVDVIYDIKKNIKTSKLHLELLFNDEIINEYELMLKYNNEHLSACHYLDTYSTVIESMIGEGDYTSPMAELIDAEQMLEEWNYPEDKVKDFEALCNKYEIMYSESGKKDDIEVYNYKELTERIACCDRQFKKQQKELLDLMQSFVKDSISSVNKK